jgi:transposase
MRDSSRREIQIRSARCHRAWRFQFYFSVPAVPTPFATTHQRQFAIRESITRLQKTEGAIIRSLQRDPLLEERVRRLQTIPAVGKVTALSWALEMGDISRFRSIRQAISYCGLCGDEKRSADKVARTPISKQRNKYIQRVLVEAAKLAPRRNPDLALVYENARQKVNTNCATLAVARKLVAYLMAVDREQRDFEPVRGIADIAA